MGTIFGREPAAVAAFIAIAVNLAITFGLQLTADQVALVNALVVAGLALIVRRESTPINSPQLPVGTPVSTGSGGTGVVTSVVEPSATITPPTPTPEEPTP